MIIRVAGVVKESIVDGPGLRYTLFVQGCPHRCEGCHNPQTHDFNAGKDKDSSEILEDILNNPLLDGITLSGGEPFCQALSLLDLVKEVKKHNLNVIAYTGYEYEYLVENSTDENGYLLLLKEIDYLVDGKFDINKKSYLLKFKGSSNQRIIDVKKSLDSGKVVEAEIE